MALLERLAILITADASGALSEMKKVAESAEKDLGKAGAAGSTLSGQMTKVGAVMVGVGTGLLAVGISAASTTESLGKEVIKLQRFTGLSAEESSKLAYAARMSGIDIDTLTTNLGRLAKQMEASPQKFAALGVEVRSSDGTMRSMSDVLMDVAGKFKAMGPGTEATAAALQLFGRSGAAMLPFLLKGKEGIAELTSEAEKMGLVLSQDNVNAVKDHIKAQRELKAAIDGVKNQIGMEMLPILTNFTKLIAGLPGPVKDLAGPFVVVGGAVALAGGAFLIMAGQVNKAKLAYLEMSATSQIMVKSLGLVTLAATAGIAVWQTWTSNLEQAKTKTVSALNEMVNQAATDGLNGLGSSIDDLRSRADKLTNASNGWNHVEWFWDRAKHKGDAEGLRQIADQMETLKTQAEALGTATGRSNEEALKWLLTMFNAGNTFPDVETALAAYTGKIDLNKLSSESAAIAQDGLADSIKNANDAYRAAVDPFFAVIHAQEDLAEKTKAYQDAINGGKATQEELDAAYLKQVESASRLQSTLVELGQKQISGTTDADKFRQAMEFLRTQGIDPGTEAGKRLIEKITGISWEAAVTAQFLNDHPIKPKTDSSEVDDAKRKLEELRAVIRDVLGLNNTLTGAYGQGLGIMVPKAPGSAIGGRVGAGDARLVGELGPELFLPDTAGTIVTARETASMLGGGGGSTNVTYAINVNVDPTADKATVGKSVVEAIKLYELRSGSGWRS